jgi:hypothetical protein
MGRISELSRFRPEKLSNWKFVTPAAVNTYVFLKLLALKLVLPFGNSSQNQRLEQHTPMDRTILTLHEYRLRYPDTAEIPTLTQSGLLGVLLDRQQRKAASLARRRAMWRSVSAAPRNVCVGIWRVLAFPGLHDSTTPTDAPVRRQA